MSAFSAPSLRFFASLGLASVAAGQGFNEPPIAPDINPDPNIVEVNLSAGVTTWQFTPGVDTTVWAYNGTVPGPTIHAEKGDTIRVNFTNNLPEETTVHWHGIEVPAMMDGSHISQAAIQPGESFTYEFVATVDQMAWYHPHVRPFDQVEKGLYGAVIVRHSALEAELGFNVAEEHVMFFDDILLDAGDEIVPSFSFADPLQNAAYQLNGREGNMLLVNGKDASTASLSVPNGVPQRWRIVNVANTTFCRLDINDPDDGIDEDVWQVGSDGGFNDFPFRLLPVTVTGAIVPGPDHPNQALVNQMGEGVYLTPGERSDVIFTPIGSDGETFTIYQHDWFRGRHVPTYGSAGQIMLPDDPLDGLYPKQKWLDMTVQGPDPGNGELAMPPKLRHFKPLDRNIANYTVIPMVYGHGLPDAAGNVTLFVQAEFDTAGVMTPLPAKKITSLKAHDVDAGQTYMWEITNLTHGDHNFHAHGFFFELLEYQFIDMVDPTNNAIFQPSARRMQKDVLRVPPRLGAKGTSKTITRLKVNFAEAGRVGTVEAGGELPVFGPMGQFSSGGWLVHCHILEHSGRGMLSFFEVRDPNQPFHALGSFFVGAAGPTYLSAEGDFSPGSTVDMHIMNALPNQAVILLMGNFEANRTFRGGNLVPGHSKNGTTLAGKPTFSWRKTLTTDANGDVSFSVPFWHEAPSGTTLYWQAAYRDTSLPGLWSFSNALSFTRP
jgi:FtsP/CotA-like multicopper oxidase with cupredoxin domain